MPTRSCIICRKKDEKKNLIRIAKDINNNAIFDKSQKINSRAIYFCNDKRCRERFFKLRLNGKLNINFSINMKSLEEVLNEIIKHIYYLEKEVEYG